MAAVRDARAACGLARLKSAEEELASIASGSVVHGARSCSHAARTFSNGASSSGAPYHHRSTWMPAPSSHRGRGTSQLARGRRLCAGDPHTMRSAARSPVSRFDAHARWSTPPLPLGRLSLSRGDLPGLLADLALTVGFTQLFNASGHPAMSVPLFWNGAGVPVGVQFAGRFGDEATLFRLAAQLDPRGRGSRGGRRWRVGRENPGRLSTGWLRCWRAGELDYPVPQSLDDRASRGRRNR